VIILFKTINNALKIDKKFIAVITSIAVIFSIGLTTVNAGGSPQSAPSVEESTQPVPSVEKSVPPGEEDGFGAQIINTGKEYLGTPYKFNSSSNTTKTFDASSFVQRVFKENGVELPRNSREQSTQGVRVDTPQIGDLLFFNTDKKTTPRIDHVAIYMGDGKILEARTGGVQVGQYEKWKEAHKRADYLIKRITPPVEQPVKPAPPVEQPTKPVPPTKPTPSPDKPIKPAPPVEGDGFGDKIINSGKKYLGTPYQFGAPASTTNIFDCSSFVQRVFKENGVKLPRNSRQQSTQGVSVTTPQKGDLMFFKTDKKTPDRITHVGIYMGNGEILHSIPKGGVQISKYSGYWKQTHVLTKRVK
jgi:cell wall-associated NlpC family hydrolase